MSCSGVVLLLLLPLLLGCASPLNVDDYPNLAVVVDCCGSIAGPYRQSCETSVKQEFMDRLNAKGYNIQAGGDDQKRVVKGLAAQLSDLTEDSVVEVGKHIDASALVAVEIVEFSANRIPAARGETRVFETQAKVQAAVWDLQRGALLWSGKYSDYSGGEIQRPDKDLLDDVAARVANACPPKPWWWYVWWPVCGWW